MAAVDTPARQLAGFVDRYDPAIRRLVRSARSKLRKRLPGAVELVYDNYNALAIGFGPTERATDAVVSLAVYPRWVSLYFLRGIELSDPENLLKGSGKQGRFVVLESADDLDRAPIAALLEEALRNSRVGFESRRGYTVIKSVSVRQRSRRSRDA